MKLHSESRGTETSNNFEATAEYSISASAHMLQTLIKSAYTDPLKACIREMISNCIDAHNMSGNKDAFEVHLPTLLNPQIVFKDFGTGLSIEDVMHNYTKFGHSTKSNLNQTEAGAPIIGGFGWGCKTPLAVTDTFTVESRFEGVTTGYVCLQNDTGMYEIKRIGSQKSTEPDGLTVKVPLDGSDYRRAQKVLAEILEFQDFPVIVKGVEDFKANSRKCILKGKGFRMSESATSYYSNDGARVIVGGYAFDIDFEQLTLTESSYRGLDIFLEMGDVDLAVSRESLLYSDKTKEFLEKKLIEVRTSVIKELTKELKKIPNKYLKNKRFREIKKNSSFITTQDATDAGCLSDTYFDCPSKTSEEVWSTKSIRLMSKRTLYRYTFDKIFIIVDDKQNKDIKTRQYCKEYDAEIIQITKEVWDSCAYEELGKPPKEFVVYTSDIEYDPKKITKLTNVACYEPTKWVHGSSKEVVDASTLSKGLYYILLDHEGILLKGDRIPITNEVIRKVWPKDELYGVFATNKAKVEAYGWKDGSDMLLDKIVEYRDESLQSAIGERARHMFEINNLLTNLCVLISHDSFVITDYNKELAEKTMKFCSARAKYQKIFEHNTNAVWENLSTQRITNSAQLMLETYNKAGRKFTKVFKAQKTMKELGQETLEAEWRETFPMLSAINTHAMDEKAACDYFEHYSK
tara:strand:+ start:1415 stop:3481 length:2067 start_codon:yes stop_codon:yes gene_type:complete